MAKIIFPDAFFEQEMRQGFTVSEVMKRFWAAHLTVLEEMEDICDRHSLNMFACYGTLLGAVREHGFIAWDDDIDIGFVGEDYVRFLDALSTEAGNRYTIFNPYTRSWHNMNFTHIVNSGNVSFDRDYLNKWHGCPFMTGPDVYPYYYIPRNPSDEQFIMTLLDKIDGAIALNKQLTETAENPHMSKENGRLNEAVAIKLVELQRETGYVFDTDRPIENQLEILYDQVCRFTEEQDADYVTRYDEYAKNRNKKYPKDYFSTTIRMPFEHISIPVPIGYDAILRARFGNNYVVPRTEPSTHDYPCYSKQLTDEEYYKMETSNINPDAVLSVPQDRPHDKKVILYHTGVRDMLMHCETAINKIDRVLQYFMEKKDCIEVRWLPDIFLKTEEISMDTVAPKLVSEYEEIIRHFHDAGGIVYDINVRPDYIIDGCDEYYGDDGILANKFRKSGKTLTIQDYSSMDIEIDEQYNCCESVIDAADEKSNKKQNKAEIPIEWKRVILRPDGSQKKIMLFVSSISILYQYKKQALKKLQYVLDMFRENSENIALLWRPVADIYDIERAFDNAFVQKYVDIIDDFRSAGWGILDETKTPDTALELADAAYGDPDAIIMKCFKAGKPVMIEDPEIISSV